MRLHRGLWAGACLLLALVGCGKKDESLGPGGVYSPILTGISSSIEPAGRGVPNQLTARVTNISALPLTYHWSVAAGTLTDSTNATATWTPPDIIGIYDVTVSIEAQDGGTHYFRTMTVHMPVDNIYTRWTRSEAVEFDPASTSGGSLLYAEYHSSTSGPADIYRATAPLSAPSQLTSGFFSATSPTPRADEAQFGFAGKIQSTESSPSIYLLPMGGGDVAAAQLVEGRNTLQTILAFPRFGRTGDRIAYMTDSTSSDLSGTLNIHWRDAANLIVQPTAIIDATVYAQSELTQFALTGASWGPDKDLDGDPDSIMVLSYGFYNTPSQTVNGIYLFATPDSGKARTWDLWLSGAPIEDPDWSPDGTHVVFARKNAGTGDRDIWIINRASADLSGAVRVTSGPADDSQPRFSADGTQIFFVTNRVDKYGVGGLFQLERRGRNIWSVARFDVP